MPTVAVVDGVKILFYADDHPPPHFHALFPEHEAKIRVEDLGPERGSLSRPKMKSVLDWASIRQPLLRRLVDRAGEAQAGEDRVTEIVCMASVEPVLYGVVKIVWRDGYQGVVDLRPVIGDGDVFAFLRASADRFSDVAIDEHGHRLFGVDDGGDEIDLGSESLRIRSERQDELLRVAG